MPKEYLNIHLRSKTEKLIVDILMEAPRDNSEAKLKHFVYGATGVVHHLLTVGQMRDRGGIDALLVTLRSKLGTVSTTKRLTQPVVFLSLVMNAALILAYDHTANDMTFSIQTYRRWHYAYYVMLFAAPLHTILNVSHEF